MNMVHHYKTQAFYLKTEKSLNFLSVNDSYMIAMIKNPDKPQKWANFSVMIIEMCGETIACPLKLTF